MGIKGWIEEHPYLTGGAVLGIIVLYFLLSSGSSSSSTAATSQGVGGSGLSSSDYVSLQEAQLQTGAQLTAQQNTATEQSNQYSAELAATQINANTTSQANQLAAQVQLQNIVTSGTVSTNANETALATANAQIGGQITIAGIGAQQNEYDTSSAANVSEFNTGTQAGVMENEYNNAVASQKIVSDAQTAQAGINADTQTSIAQYAANVNLAQIGAGEFTTQTAGQVSMAGINAQAGVENNQITTQGQEYQTGETTSLAALIAQLNASTTKTNAGIAVVNSGVLNKGGSGGANQVSFLSTLFGGSGNAPTPTNSGFGISIPGVGSVGVSNP